MKKILLLIIVFFGISLVNVSASTSDKFYSGDWIPNIYINKVKSGTIHYRQARFIRRTSNKGIAYCIEPFEDMNTKDKYTGYSSDYAKHLGINEATWKKISLIAYYGYGYTNHTSDKWYAITQVMIWREVDKNAQFYFTDSLNGVKTNKYDSEIGEINSLIAKHNILPSFANKGYNFSIDSQNTLNDTNSVLNLYNIESNDGNIDVSKSSNNLIISTKNETNSTITFKRDFNKYNSQSIVFVDSNYQNLMAPGNVDSIKFNINIKVNGGRIKITKVDADTLEKTPQGEGTLIGCTYNLYNSDGDIVDTLEIDENNEAISKLLPFGTYKLKEEKNMRGYRLDQKEYTLTIKSNNTDISLTLTNKAIKSTLEIYKYFDEKLEAGISFEIYNNKSELIDTVTTDENGKISKELYYGTYKFHQLNSTKNYKCVDDFEVIINEESTPVIRLDLKDEKFSSRLIITKKDSKTGEIIKDETVFKIFNLEENDYIKINGSDELKTKDGVLVIDKIEAGKYELEEFIAPKGYRIKTDKIKFTIDEDNKYKYDEKNYPIYEINVENEKIEIKVPNTGQDFVEKTLFLVDDKKKLV